MKDQINKFRDAVFAKDFKVAEDVLLRGVSVNADQFIRLAREKGIFRSGRFGFSREVVAPLAESALSRAGGALSEASRIYLSSVLALMELAPSVAARLKKAHMFVNSGQFKSFLVTTDLLFRRMHKKIEVEKVLRWQNVGLEDLAEGFSYYFSLLRERGAITKSDINKIHTSRIGTGFYEDKLALFASICHFREAEFQVEAFPYSASTHGAETTIEAISPDFEKSVRWGYIASEEQRNADRANWTEEGMPSLKDLAVALIDSIGDKVFEVIEGNAARIRMHLPLIEGFVAAFKDDRFFVEDVAFIREAMKSLFVPYELLRTTQIKGSLTLIDVLKFRRLCVFIQAALDEFCKRRGFLNKPLYYNSLVSHMNETEAVSFISEITGIGDPLSLLELLCATDKTSSVFDVQYTPVMKVAGQYLFPIGVIANCNVLRNALQVTQFRFDSGAKMDPLGKRLVEAFDEAGVQAKAKVKIRHGGREVEADVLAILDGHVFAFECKNSLHPCNSFELRQSYDHIVKGAAQLDRFKQTFGDEKLRRMILSAAGFKQRSSLSLTTCIVTGNRMFNGHREAGHAVRNIYELENAIVGDGLKLVPFPKNPEDPDGAKIRIRVPSRKSEKITATDLIDYIENDSWLAPAFEAMEPYDEVVTFGQRSLRWRHFILEVWTYRRLMRKHPQAIEEEA